jgi:hypothetical protein
VSQGVRLSTKEAREYSKYSPISEYLSKIERKGGLKGGPASAKKLSEKLRREIVKKAAQVRSKKED